MTMAQAKQTPQEFIQNAFSPSIAAICSTDAENLCQKNNLSFVELVQPFCRFNSEANFKDPMNQSCSIRNLRIILKDINAQPPQQSVAKKMLNDVVLSCQLAGESNRSVVVKSLESEIVLPAVLPWFEAYRDCFFEIHYPSDHEFTKHFLACVFVVSSSNQNPVAELTRLNQLQHQLQHQTPSKSPKWFLPNIFKGFIILHDISEGDNSKAEAVYQSAKTTFPGSFCHLLQINSRSINAAQQMTTVGVDGAQPPDPWSQFLSKKIDANESSEYDNSPRTPQEDNIFPSKLSEGGSDLDITHISEPTEIADISSERTGTFHHPLSPETDVISLNCVSQDKSDKSLKVETVNEEDTPLAGIINDTVVPWTKEQLPVHRPHGLCLTVSDMDRLRIFIHEFVLRGLLPYVEKQMKFLHEAVATRKGLHRSLLSATKKWFVGNKPGFQGPSSPTNTVVYSQEATELQVRKLGDLAFMFQHYDLAYQAYHTAKRDFNSDQAWIYFAGALEMAALSIFMLGANSQRQYPFHYFENAINTYLNVCKNSQFATRATLLSSECLKSKGMFGEAAMQFIKMTCEDSDLRSALLLEQAAHCFTAMATPMSRKYAFHMILAGHRFSKAGQRKHALRAYKQAYQVYKSKNWSLAEDHVNFTIGRQSLNLKQLQQALNAFQSLLNKNSQQSASQQTAFLREYLFVYNLTREQSTGECCGHLPLPIIENQNTKVILGPISVFSKEQLPHASSSFADDEENDHRWFKLEELAYQFVRGCPAVSFRPYLHRLTQFTNNSYRPFAVLKEPVTIEIVMNNPFHIPLFLSNIYLLWKFSTDKTGSDGECHQQTITNDNDRAEQNNKYDDVVKTESISELVLESCHLEKVCLSLLPQQMGELVILGVSYELGTYSPTEHVDGNSECQSIRNSNTITAPGKQYIEVCGPRLNNTKAEKVTKTYGPDYRLECTVVDSMPYLQINFLNFPTSVLCGEIQQIILELTNVGDDDIINICVSSLTPETFTFGQDSDVASMSFPVPSSASAANNNLYNEFIGKSSEIVAEVSCVDRVCYVPLPKGWTSLKARKTYKLPMWIRGPDEPGTHNMQFLFYYESSESKSSLKYRVFRYTAQFSVYNSLSVKAFAIRNHTHLAKDNMSSLAIAMEVENINEIQGAKITDIGITQVSSASKNWILQPMGKPPENDIVIRPKETANLCYRAVKLLNQSSSQSESSVMFSNISYNNREIDSSTTPCSDFCYRCQLNLPTLVMDDSGPSLSETMSSSIHMSSFTSNVSHCDNFGIEHQENVENSLHIGLTMIVIWKAILTNIGGSNSCIMGQHHIRIDKINNFTSAEIEGKAGEPFGPIRAPEIEQPANEVENSASNASLMQMVQTVVLHPHQIDHSFDESRTCIVFVTVIVHNCSSSNLWIVIDAVKASGSYAPVKNPAIQPSGYLSTFPMPNPSMFTWIGATYNCLTLQPGETAQIPLRVCFFTAGTYNLGNIFVGARCISDTDEAIIPQQPCAPSLIIVNNVCHPS